MVPSWFWGEGGRKTTTLPLPLTFTPLPTHPLSHYTPKKQGLGGEEEKEKKSVQQTNKPRKMRYFHLNFPKKGRKKFRHVNKFPALFLEPNSGEFSKQLFFRSILFLSPLPPSLKTGPSPPLPFNG
jgi:hypothetical protein